MIHIVTIPALFAAGAVLVVSGFVFQVFQCPALHLGSGSTLKSFPELSAFGILNDRFSALSELEDT